MSAIKRHAKAISDNPMADGYGVSPELILLIAQYAIPALVRCWTNSRSGVAAESKSVAVKKLAEDSWLPAANGYEWRVIRKMRPATRDAAIKANQNLTPPQLDIMSAAILDRARLGDISEIDECLTEVATIDLSTFPDPGVV